jgi:hypothetical protein
MSTWMIVIRATLALVAAGAFVNEDKFAPAMLFAAYALADFAALWMTL